MKRRLIKSLLLASILAMAGAQPALAYIDPNAGGLLFQLLAVAFASISAIALLFSRQIRKLLARIGRALRGLPEATADATSADPGSAESPETGALPSPDAALHPTTPTEPSVPGADDSPSDR